MANRPPPSFRTDVHRNPTKKWADAKSYSYAGDDWAGYDEYDEYGSYDEPEPAPKPTGLRQRGQALPSVDTGNGKQPLSGGLQRSNSFEYGDDRRPLTPVAQSPTNNAAGASPRVSQGLRRPSQDAGPYGQGRYAAPHDPNATVSSPTYGASQPTMAARTSSLADPPTALSPTMKAPRSTENFPPRKSSSGPAQTAPPPAQLSSAMGGITIPESSAPISDQYSGTNAARVESPSIDNAPRFVRPADIYRRIEQEKEKQRQSMDTSRPTSMDPVQSPSLTKVMPTGRTPETPSSTTAIPPSLKVGPDTTNEYGLGGFTVTSPALAQAIGANVAAPSTESNPAAPTLPVLTRFSGFGTDFLGMPSKEDAAAEQSIPQSRDTTTSMGMPASTSLSPQSAADAPQLSGVGIKSVVDRAFAPRNEPLGAASHSPNLGSELSRDNSTAGISPILSGVPDTKSAGESTQEPGSDIPHGLREAKSSEGEETAGTSQIPAASVVPPTDIGPGLLSEPPQVESRSSILESHSESQYSQPGTLETEPANAGNMVLNTGSIPITGADPAIGANASRAAESDGPSPDEDDRASSGSDKSTPVMPSSAFGASKIQSPTSAVFQEPTRVGSPSKGRVRDLADRYNEIHETRTGSVSPVSSLTSKRRGESLSSSGTSENEDAAGSTMSEAQSKESGVAPGESLQARPHLPGSWVSYANSERSITTNEDNANNNEDEPLSAATPKAASPESEAETPRAEKEEIDFSPTNRNAASNLGATPDPLTALQAAGSAIADSLMATVGLKEGETDREGDDDERVSSEPRNLADRTTGNLIAPRIYADDSAVTPGVDTEPEPSSVGTPSADSGEYFPDAAPAPLKQRGLSPVLSPQGVEAMPKEPTSRSVSYMSDGSLLQDTEASPDDTENDRLRKDIVRSLNVPDGHGGAKSAAADRGSNISNANSVGDMSRASSILPREYDSYWADTGENPGRTGTPPTLVSAPSEAATKAQEPVAVASASSRPTLGSHRFSWEDESEADAPDDFVQQPGLLGPIALPTATLFGSRSQGDEPAEATRSRDISHNQEEIDEKDLGNEAAEPSRDAASLDEEDEDDDDGAEVFRSRGVQKAPAFSPIEEEEDSPTALKLSSQQPMSPISAVGSPLSQTRTPETPGHVEEASAFRYAEPSVGPVKIDTSSPLDKSRTDDDINVEHSMSSPTTNTVKPSFQEILKIKQYDDRIRTYHDTRRTFAQEDSGLGNWLSYMVAAHPEHAQAAPAMQRPAIDTSLAASMRSKFTPGASKVRGSPSANNQPYYQQYLESAGGFGSANSVGSPTGGPSSAGKIATGRSVSGPASSKGKDLLHTASILGGKAGSSAKGFFAKGRSKFKGSEKVSPASKAKTRSPSKSAQDDPPTVVQSQSPFQSQPAGDMDADADPTATVAAAVAPHLNTVAEQPQSTSQTYIPDHSSRDIPAPQTTSSNIDTSPKPRRRADVVNSAWSPSKGYVHAPRLEAPVSSPNVEDASRNVERIEAPVQTDRTTDWAGVGSAENARLDTTHGLQQDQVAPAVGSNVASNQPIEEQVREADTSGGPNVVDSQAAGVDSGTPALHSQAAAAEPGTDRVVDSPTGGEFFDAQEDQTQQGEHNTKEQPNLENPASSHREAVRNGVHTSPLGPSEVDTKQTERATGNSSAMKITYLRTDVASDSDKRNSQLEVHPLFRTPEQSPTIVRSPMDQLALNKDLKVDDDVDELESEQVSKARYPQTSPDRVMAVDSPIVSPSAPGNLDELPPSVRKQYMTMGRSRAASQGVGSSDGVPTGALGGSNTQAVDKGKKPMGTTPTQAFDEGNIHAGSTPTQTRPDRLSRYDEDNEISSSSQTYQVPTYARPNRLSRYGEGTDASPSTQTIQNKRRSADPRSNDTEYHLDGIDLPPPRDLSSSRDRKPSPWRRFRLRGRGMSLGDDQAVGGEAGAESGAGVLQNDETREPSAWQRLRARSRGATPDAAAVEPETDAQVLSSEEGRRSSTWQRLRARSKGTTPDAIVAEPTQIDTNVAESQQPFSASSGRGRSPWQKYRERSRGASMDQGGAASVSTPQRQQQQQQQPAGLQTSQTEPLEIASRRARTSSLPWKRRSWFRPQETLPQGRFPIDEPPSATKRNDLPESDQAAEVRRVENRGPESSTTPRGTTPLDKTPKKLRPRKRAASDTNKPLPRTPDEMKTHSYDVDPARLEESDKPEMVRKREARGPGIRSAPARDRTRAASQPIASESISQYERNPLVTSPNDNRPSSAAQPSIIRTSMDQGRGSSFDRPATADQYNRRRGPGHSSKPSLYGQVRRNMGRRSASDGAGGNLSSTIDTVPPRIPSFRHFSSGRDGQAFEIEDPVISGRDGNPNQVEKPVVSGREELPYKNNDLVTSGREYRSTVAEIPITSDREHRSTVAEIPITSDREHRSTVAEIPITSSRNEQTPAVDNRPFASRPRHQSTNRQMDPLDMMSPGNEPIVGNNTPGNERNGNLYSTNERISTSSTRPLPEKKPSQDSQMANKRNSWFSGMFTANDNRQETRRLSKTNKRRSLISSKKDDSDQRTDVPADDWAAQAEQSLNRIGRTPSWAPARRESPIENIPPLPVNKRSSPTRPVGWVPPVQNRETHVSYLQDMDIFPARPKSTDGGRSTEGKPSMDGRKSTEVGTSTDARVPAERSVLSTTNGRSSVDNSGRSTSPPPDITSETQGADEGYVPPVPKLPQDVNTPNSIRNSTYRHSTGPPPREILNPPSGSTTLSSGVPLTDNVQPTTSGNQDKRRADIQNETVPEGLSTSTRQSFTPTQNYPQPSSTNPNQTPPFTGPLTHQYNSRTIPRRKPYTHQSRSSGDGPPPRYVPWLSKYNTTTQRRTLETSTVNPSPPANQSSIAPLALKGQYTIPESEPVVPVFSGRYSRPQNGPSYASEASEASRAGEARRIGEASTPYEANRMRKASTPYEASTSHEAYGANEASRTSEASTTLHTHTRNLQSNRISRDSDDTTTDPPPLSSMLPSGMHSHSHSYSNSQSQSHGMRASDEHGLRAPDDFSVSREREIEREMERERERESMISRPDTAVTDTTAYEDAVSRISTGVSDGGGYTGNEDADEEPQARYTIPSYGQSQSHGHIQGHEYGYAAYNR